jgi:phosphopantetheinyl transferase
MPPEPPLRWRRQIGGKSTLPAAWLLEIGASVADANVRLALATAAIRAAVGYPGIEVHRSGSGAPVVSDSTMCVSTASRHGCFAIALARGPVGVDLEAVAPLDPMPLAVLHADERAFVSGASIDTFFVLWTAKEAYLKFAGLGFGHGDELVSVIPHLDKALVRRAGSNVLTLRRETATLRSERGAYFATCLLI